MITFQPLKILAQNLDGQDGVQSIKDTFANEKLAKQLNLMFQSNACVDHPDFESVVLVNLNDDPDFLRVISCCCTDFKAELEGLAEQQKNYTNIHS